MAISDFNSVKEIKTKDVSGSPSQDLARPIHIVGGDESTTTTGAIEIDFTNIAGKSDISFFDMNGNLLDYHFDYFDISTSGSEEIWAFIHHNWTLDGTSHVQLAYGNGPQDNESAESSVWTVSSAPNYKARYSMAEGDADAYDSTSNNYGGSVAQSTMVSGGVYLNGQVELDGSSEYIHVVSGVSEGTSQFDSGYFLSFWVNFDDAQSDANFISFVNSSSEAVIKLSYQYDGSDGDLTITHRQGSLDVDGVTEDPFNPSENTWHHIVALYDGSTVYLYMDNSQLINGSIGNIMSATIEDIYIGAVKSGSDYLDGSMDNVVFGTDNYPVEFAGTEYAIQNDQFYSQTAATSDNTAPTADFSYQVLGRN